MMMKPLDPRSTFVLFVPNFSYSLLSVSKISSPGKMTRFHNTGCKILNKEKNCFCHAFGNFYHL